MPTAPCQDLPEQAFLGSDQNERSFARQLATSGLCKSFDDGHHFEGRFDELNKRLPCVALVLAARANLDSSFLSDDAAAASYKSKAKYTSPAANYTLLVSRLARAAEVRAVEEKKVTTLLEGQRFLLWSQRRGSKEPASAGTMALVDALRRAGVQKAASPPPRASSRAAQAEAAKVAKVVAAAAREGEEEGVAFLGGSISLPDEIVAIVLSFSLPLALCVAPLVAKAWLAVSHLPALHKTLKIPVRGHTLEHASECCAWPRTGIVRVLVPPFARPRATASCAQDKMTMSAALTMLRQPRFSRVEVLGLGKTAKLGKTGASSLAKVCPHLRELDLSSLAVSKDDCASLLSAAPELTGLSFHVDSTQSYALGQTMHPLYAYPINAAAKRLSEAVLQFTSLLHLQISWDHEGEDFGDHVLTQLAEHCPKLQLLAMVNSWLGRLKDNCRWSEEAVNREIRDQARTQNLTDLGVAALLGGCPQLHSLTLKPAWFLETAFQKISDQLKASPPLLKLKHLEVTDNPTLSSPLSSPVLLRHSLATNCVK